MHITVPMKPGAEFVSRHAVAPALIPAKKPAGTDQLIVFTAFQSPPIAGACDKPRSEQLGQTDRIGKRRNRVNTIPTHCVRIRVNGE